MLTKGYKCSDLKISADRRYAGWKFAGKIIEEFEGKQQSYFDAILYVSVGEKSYPVTNNSRFINDWYFVTGKAQVVAETSFEHGPSTYMLFDLLEKKVMEACSALELVRCKALRHLVKL